MNQMPVIPSLFSTDTYGMNATVTYEKYHHVKQGFVASTHINYAFFMSHLWSFCFVLQHRLRIFISLPSIKQGLCVISLN